MTQDQVAQYEIAAGLEAGCAANESDLDGLVCKLADWLDDSLDNQQKVIAKVQSKLRGKITAAQTRDANALDSIFTGLVRWIDNGLSNSEWTLTGIGTKAGVVQPGQAIDQVDWQPDPGQSLGPEYGGTLVLSCRELGPALEPLLEVLREIRDRIGGAPVVVAGESPETVVVAKDSWPDWVEGVA